LSLVKPLRLLGILIKANYDFRKEKL
jgi:hypothetical protein